MEDMQAATMATLISRPLQMTGLSKVSGLGGEFVMILSFEYDMGSKKRTYKLGRQGRFWIGIRYEPLM